MAATATERRFAFDVFLDSRPLGSHRFTIHGAPEAEATVESEARFDVRILGIDVYRYRHRATERWAEGCLVALDADTLDNGRELRVVAALQGATLHIEQPAARPPLPACTPGYAYWDRDLLLRQRVLLNPQTGTADPVSFELLGRMPLTVGNRRLEAEQYRLHSPGHTIDLWYSPDGEWLQLESTVESGRRLVYRRRDAGT